MAAIVAALAVFVAVRKLEAADELHRALERDLRALAVMRLDVDALDTRVRRLAGSVYSPPGRVRRSENHIDQRARGIASPNSVDALDDLDPELAAELALQTAPAVSPGK